MRQKGTNYVSLPKAVIEGFGCASGGIVLVEHPFSRAAIIVPLDQGVLAPNTEAVRAFGWATARMATDWLTERWQVLEPGGDVPCQGCGFHRATSRMREVHVCKYCTIEIASAMAFRQRPSQPELALVKGVV